MGPVTVTPELTKAEQLADLLDVELMPWQLAVLDYAINVKGGRVTVMAGRRAGRAQLARLTDLVDAVRAIAETNRHQLPAPVPADRWPNCTAHSPITIKGDELRCERIAFHPLPHRSHTISWP